MTAFDKLFCFKVKEQIKTADSWEKNQFIPKKEFGKEFLQKKLKQIKNEKNSNN